MHGMMDIMIQTMAQTMIDFSTTEFDSEDAGYAAPLAAAEFAGILRGANGMSLMCLLNAAVKSDGVKESGDFAECFARAITLEAMGHGTSWTDGHKPVKLLSGPMKVPFIDSDELIASYILH